MPTLLLGTIYTILATGMFGIRLATMEELWIQSHGLHVSDKVTSVCILHAEHLIVGSKCEYVCNGIRAPCMDPRALQYKNVSATCTWLL